MDINHFFNGFWLTEVACSIKNPHKTRWRPAAEQHLSPASATVSPQPWHEGEHQDRGGNDETGSPHEGHSHHDDHEKQSGPGRRFWRQFSRSLGKNRMDQACHNDDQGRDPGKCIRLSQPKSADSVWAGMIQNISKTPAPAAINPEMRLSVIDISSPLSV